MGGVDVRLSRARSGLVGGRALAAVAEADAGGGERGRLEGGEGGVDAAKPEAVPDLPAVGSKLKVVAPVVAARKTSLGTSSQSGNLQRGEILTHDPPRPPVAPGPAHVNCQDTFRTAIGKLQHNAEFTCV